MELLMSSANAGFAFHLHLQLVIHPLLILNTPRHEQNHQHFAVNTFKAFPWKNSFVFRLKIIIP